MPLLFQVAERNQKISRAPHRREHRRARRPYPYGKGDDKSGGRVGKRYAQQGAPRENSAKRHGNAPAGKHELDDIDSENAQKSCHGGTHEAPEAIANKTFVEYLNSKRILNAMEMLKNTDALVVDICYESGFKNVNYFNRNFKNVVGLSPTQYRKANRKSRPAAKR